MNKAYFMSFVFAAALPAMAAGDQYASFLEGVNTVDEAGVPVAVGGDWTTNSVSLANNGGKVEFDASDALMRLDVTTPGPADTNTIVKVELEASVADVGTLMESSELTGAQTAFAVCTNACHAWNGNAWVLLGDTIAEVGDDSQTTNLTVEIKYLGTNSFESGYVRAARFSIGGEVLHVRTNSSEWVALTTAANNFTGFGASGSGLLSQVDAKVMLGVAEYAGIKYGTLGEAVEVASATLLDKPTVEVLRETDESITITNNVAIADNGKIAGDIVVEGDIPVTVQPSASEFKDSSGQSVAEVTAGDYSIPVNMSGGTLSVDMSKSFPNKEAYDVSYDGVNHRLNVKIHTATTVLAGAKPDGIKALSIEGAKETALRNYLNAHAHDAYVAANVSSESLQTALSTPRTGANENGLPLYQSYALGIEPTDPVKPVAVANDEATDGVTLAIPAIVPENSSGDYTISYEVTGTTAGGETNVVSSSARAIKVPLATGSYSVKIKFQ